VHTELAAKDSLPEGRSAVTLQAVDCVANWAEIKTAIPPGMANRSPSFRGLRALALTADSRLLVTSTVRTPPPPTARKNVLHVVLTNHQLLSFNNHGSGVLVLISQSCLTGFAVNFRGPQSFVMHGCTPEPECAGVY